jgi:hypothetical protein
MSTIQAGRGLSVHRQLHPLRRSNAPGDRSAAADASFLAGQDAGARTSACVVRLAALELMDGARWWNRRRRRLMARALVACAEELEDGAWPTGCAEEVV